MYYNNKSIIFEFKYIYKTKYEKIIIKKNKIIFCKNEKIKKDIEIKINYKKMINYVEFYVSLYDYEIIKKDVFWNTIKDLDRYNLPIYKKNEDLYDFLYWFQKNFNNNIISIYETSKFTKKKYIFELNEKNECLKNI